MNMMFYQYIIQNPVPKFTDLGGLVTQFLPLAVGAAGLLTFFYLLFGGFKYLTASGDDKALGSAKQMMGQAITGLLIVVLAYVLMRLLETFLGLEVLTPK